jgi:hypothetical protein
MRWRTNDAERRLALDAQSSSATLATSGSPSKAVPLFRRGALVIQVADFAFQRAFLLDLLAGKFLPKFK